MISPPSAVSNSKIKGTASLLAPEKRFWQRYSPHHEFPLSTATSLAIYGLAGALLFFLGRYLVNLGSDATPVPVETIDVDAGGNGNPNGDGRDPADQPTLGPEAAQGTKLTLEQPTAPDTNVNIEKPNAASLPGPAVKDATSRLIQESQSAAREVDDVRGDFLKKWEQWNRSEGGSGPKGVGTDPGKGPGPGRGGNLSPQIKRMLRWQIDFQVRDGQDHLRQFAGLGAILALPDPRGGYRVFRDLDQRPLVGRIEDINTIKRIWFIDTLKEHPASVGDLTRMLGMPGASHIVAFFPEKLEKRMQADEEAFRGKKAEAITIQEKIVFQVRPRASGGYEVVVSPNQY
jgi:hypothetical protein